MSEKLLRKSVSVFLSFILFFQNIIPFVFADELILPEPTVAEAENIIPSEVTPTPETLAQTTEITFSPTPEPTPTPETTPSPTLAPTPTLEESPSQEATSSSVPGALSPTPVPTPTPSTVWTFSNLEINTVYTAPQNEKVKLVFTKLPEATGNLLIEEVTLTPAQITAFHAASSTAYDITSDMENGTFSYDLTLPLPPGNQTVEVKFAQSVDSNLQSISQEKNNTPDSITIRNLDHFTLFIIVNAGESIQDAVDQVATEGGTVAIQPGTYEENIILASPSASMEIIGSGTGGGGSIISGTISNSEPLDNLSISGLDIRDGSEGFNLFDITNSTISDNSVSNPFFSNLVLTGDFTGTTIRYNDFYLNSASDGYLTADLTNPLSLPFNYWGGGESARPDSFFVNVIEGSAEVDLDRWLVAAKDTGKPQEGSISYASDDGWLTVTGSGTATIYVGEYAQPPFDGLGDGLTAIGPYYDVITENGSVDWPLRIEISYDPDDLPEDISEKDLQGIYFYNGADWELYSDTGVDYDNQKLWANADHLTPIVAGASPSAESDSIITWPESWNTPAQCATDLSDESPSEIDLLGTSADPAVGFSSDENYQYFRERIEGNPGSVSNLHNYSWVVLFQTAMPQYQLLGSVTGKGGNKVQLYLNTVNEPDDGGVDFSPLFNDPADDDPVWEGDSADYARVTYSGGFYYIDWAIPQSVLTSYGVSSTASKYFATSANANNYNKDHLNCYEAMSDVSIVKADSPDPVDSGQTLTYTLTITNNGPDQAESVSVSDTLPVEFSLVSITSSQGSCTGTTCNLGSLDVGSQATITITGIASGDGIITNTAEVSSTTLDTDLSNNTATVQTTIQPTFTNISLTACKQVDDDGVLNTDTDRLSRLGWGMTLNYGEISDRQLTGDNGCFTWSNLGPGNYSVTEDLPDGWTALTPVIHDFGSAQSGVDQSFTFVNFANGSISGHKFNDLNGNRNWDDGEPPIADWNIYLDDSSEVDQLSITDEDGYYSFSDLGPGSYRVYEEQPSGWAQTFPAAGEYQIQMVSGGDFPDRDFGNQIRGTITIIKNAKPNAAQNFTFQSPQFGTFRLDDDNNPTLSNTKIISDLGSNTYTITESIVSGWQLTGIDCTGGTAQTNLDNRSVDITIDEAGADVICTFTNTKLTNISGKKYNDLDGDSTKDTEEPYLNDWTIKLFDAEMQLLDSSITGSGSLENGQYKFTGLFSGTYYICEELQDGWYQTSPKTGKVYNGTHCRKKTVNTGESASGINFGNFKYGRVEGYKWNDLNGDGVWNQSEPALANWTIRLGNKTSITDSSGHYEFNRLTAGTYSLTEENQTNWQPTHSPISPVSITSGLELSDQNFGNRGQGSITVHKSIIGTSTNLDKFCFTLSPDPGNGQICADNNGDAIFTSVPAGSYTAVETASDTSYTQTDTTCDQTMTITNGSDELSCTITNTRDQGTITFEKTVDDGSDVSLWTFTVGEVDGVFRSGDRITLDTGIYTVTESGSSDYTPTSVSGVCGNLDGSTARLTVTQEGGTCSFANTVKKGTITVTKNTNPAEIDDRFFFSLTQGKTEIASTTLSDGQTHSFGNLFPGNYSLTETHDGFDLSANCLDSEQYPVDPDNITLSPDETITCTFTNTQHGSITIVKDADPDNSQSFSFSGDLGDFTLTDATSSSNLRSKTFSDLSAGSYSITESSISGWNLGSIVCDGREEINLLDRNLIVNLEPGENTTCTFTNTYIPPRITLEKSNNATGDKLAGQDVVFTLTLHVFDNNIKDVSVRDLPASGFTYRPGSWVVLSNIRGLMTIPEPVYHSPGTWNLGDLLSGEIITLTYTADIDSTLPPGLFSDLAWARGSALMQTQLAQGSDGPFVGTEVKIVKDQTKTENYAVEKEEVKTSTGQVLGAATSLPDTGADSLMLLISLVNLGLGICFIKQTCNK